MMRKEVRAESYVNSQIPKEGITMHTRILKLFGLGIALVLFALATGNSGQVGSAQTGCTVTVQPGQSIQQAINNAAEGVVICLSAGTFQENIDIRKSLTLRGAGRERTIIKGVESNRPLILVLGEQASEVTVQALAFTEAGGSLTACSLNIAYCANALHIQGRAQALLEDLEFSGNESASLFLTDSAKATVRNSRFTGTLFSWGIWIRDAAQASLIQAEISQHWRGIVVEPAASLELSESLIHKNSEGLKGSGQLRVHSTTFSENGVAIRLSDGRLELGDSSLQNNSSYGLAVENHSQEEIDLVISDTTITGNGVSGLHICVENLRCQAGVEARLQGVRLLGNGKVGLYLGACPRGECLTQLTVVDSEIVGNGGYGLLFYSEGKFQGEFSKLIIQNSRISGNGRGGLYIVGFAEVILEGAQLIRNAGTGVEVALLEGQVDLVGNTIQYNLGRGLTARSENIRECRGNTISHNLMGDFDSWELSQRCSSQGATEAVAKRPLFPPLPEIPRPARSDTQVTSSTDCTRTLQSGQSIQQAIDELPSGAVLCLASGAFRENITINKSLTLQGEPSAEIEAAQKDEPVISIDDASNLQVALKGLRVTGAQENTGIAVSINQSRIRLQDVDLLYNSIGLWLEGGVGLEVDISKSDINAKVAGIRFSGGRGFIRVTLEDTNIHGGDFALDFFSFDSQNLHLFLLRSKLEIARRSSSFPSRRDIGSNAQLVLKDSDLTGNPLALEGAARAQIENSRLGTLELKDAAQATMRNVTFVRGGLNLSEAGQAKISSSSFVQSDIGIAARGANPLLVTDSWLVSGRIGLDLVGVGSATLKMVRVLGNVEDGLIASGATAVEIEDGLLEGNGTDARCWDFASAVYWQCNGVEASGFSQLTIRDSVIRQNTDWGIEAGCSFFFMGKVVFEGTNTVEGNNRSGNHNGMGNPGNHPFKNLPDGQVCLP